MAISMEEILDEQLRDPEFVAIYLSGSIEEGDPLEMRHDLVRLAEAMSRNAPRVHHGLPQRMKALLPETGGLPMVVLCEAVQMLGLRLRVMTKAEAIAHQDAISDSRPIPPLAVQVTSDFDEIFHRGLSLRQSLVAVAYLTACLAEGSERQIQMETRGVIECKRNRMRKVAKRMRMQPEAIYEMLTGEGNPTVTGFIQILRGLRFEMKAEAVPQRENAKRKKTARAAA